MTHTLDPDDWNAFRARAHKLLDDVIDHMETYREGSVWHSPDNAATTLSLAGGTGTGEAQTDAALKSLLPFGVGNTHPRFFGWVHGAGTPSGILADMVAAGMNANCGGRNHAAIRIERDLIAYCLSLFGFPDTGSGLITSGTSMATVVALKVARDKALGFADRTTGLADSAHLVGYTSEGAHNCIARAFDILGLGWNGLRKIPVDADRRMDADALAATIAEDRANGLKPFLVCATAGTVNTGAIDDLELIGSIARENGLWFHIDAAFAAALQFSPTHRDRLAGLSKADSLAFDFHKWMQVNYDAGCVLVREEELHRRAFSDRPDYLSGTTRGLAAGNPWPVEYGPELSRGFRALKVWSQLLEHGPDKLGQIVDANIEQAGYLAQKVEQSVSLELLAYRGLNICCFRYIGQGLDEAGLDALNEEIVIRLQEAGIAAPSTTRIGEKLAIRVNITNHRTQLSDIDVLLDAVIGIGLGVNQI